MYCLRVQGIQHRILPQAVAGQARVCPRLTGQVPGPGYCRISKDILALTRYLTIVLFTTVAWNSLM